MKARFDAGTDVAMIGAWDARRGAAPFTAEEYRRLSETLDADAARGDLFVLHTHGDGGGPVDVYVDEPIPSEHSARLTIVGEQCILALPSGALIVDGVEHYRAKQPDAKQVDRAVAIPPGDYLLRCYAATDEEAAAPRSERDLEAAVGADDLRYYERVTRAGCLAGLLMLFLFPVLGPFVGWKWAFGTTVVLIVAFFNIREWVLRRNVRFARLRERVTAFRLQHQEPTFVLELRHVPDRAGLTGGSVSLP